MQRLPLVLAGDRILDAVALPLVSVAQAVILGIGIFATREAFGALHGGAALPSQTLIKLAAAGSAVAGLEVLRRIFAERLGQSYANSLRLVLYRHLAGMPKSALAQKRLGALSLRFVGDLSTARNWFSRGLPNLISATAILPGACLVLWLLEPRIAILAYLTLGIAVLLMAFAAFGFRAVHRSLRRGRANIAISMMERIAIAPVLDLIGRTAQELKVLDQKGSQLRVDATRRALRAGVLSAVPHIGLAMAGVATLWQAAKFGTPPGTVAAALAIFGILALPLRNLAVSWDQFTGWQIARQKALNVLNMDSRLRKAVPRNHAVPVTVSGKLAQQNLALEIPAGAVGWLRGGRAPDRSALALVLAGLDDSRALRIGYGTQTEPLPAIEFIGDVPIALQGSLRRNLTLGVSPRPKGKAIVQMARDFGLNGLVRQGRRSLNDPIVEAARNVSVADGFRIDLVRAALANPDLVVIDTLRLTMIPENARLLRLLKERTDSTIILIDRADTDNQSIEFIACQNRVVSFPNDRSRLH